MKNENIDTLESFIKSIFGIAGLVLLMLGLIKTNQLMSIVGGFLFVGGMNK